MAIDNVRLQDLITEAGSADKAIELLRSVAKTSVKDTYSGGLDKAATLSVTNWDAIDALRFKPVRNDNPPAAHFEQLLKDLEADFDARDTVAILQDLFLLYKAVKRG